MPKFIVVSVSVMSAHVRYERDIKDTLGHTKVGVTFVSPFQAHVMYLCSTRLLRSMDTAKIPDVSIPHAIYTPKYSREHQNKGQIRVDVSKLCRIRVLAT